MVPNNLALRTQRSCQHGNICSHAATAGTIIPRRAGICWLAIKQYLRQWCAERTRRYDPIHANYDIANMCNGPIFAKGPRSLPPNANSARGTAMTGSASCISCRLCCTVSRRLALLLAGWYLLHAPAPYRHYLCYRHYCLHWLVTLYPNEAVSAFAGGPALPTSVANRYQLCYRHHSGRQMAGQVHILQLHDRP